MNIGLENYNELIKLLGELIDNVEYETIERVYDNGCSREYESVDAYAIPEDEIDFDKLEDLYKRLKGLRTDKIDSVLE